MRKRLLLAIVAILLTGVAAFFFLGGDKGPVEEFRFMDCPDCDQPAMDRTYPW